jgi:photosystem II stability/assembly factor-like uncharacterized protein
MTSQKLVWRKTNAPTASSRTDDIWFVSPDVGWAVNSDGNIIKTENGGGSWVNQHSDSEVYLRCVGFAGTQRGWVGSISDIRRLFATTDGTHWNLVENLPPTPNKVCGLSVVDEQVVYGSGTNDPRDRPAVLKTVDGGANWTSIDMAAHASLLVDIHFATRERGWVVGGRGVPANPGQPVSRRMVQPVMLFTEDGGASWTDLVPDKTGFPHGEWGWKIFFVDDRVIVVSLENFSAGAILKSADGGKTWRRLPINDQKHNTNLEGVGFISENVGWVGGWGDPNFTSGLTSATNDGGQNWSDATDVVGRFINRFRFFGSPVTIGYASGDTVYKYSAEPVPPPPVAAAAASASLLRSPASTAVMHEDPIVRIPQGARRLRVDLWDRFGGHLELENEQNPQAGDRTLRIDRQAAVNAGLVGPAGILRVTVDGRAESRLLQLN